MKLVTITIVRRLIAPIMIAAAPILIPPTVALLKGVAAFLENRLQKPSSLRSQSRRPIGVQAPQQGTDDPNLAIVGVDSRAEEVPA
jgi:hypothetical protein